MSSEHIDVRGCWNCLRSLRARYEFCPLCHAPLAIVQRCHVRVGGKQITVNKITAHLFQPGSHAPPVTNGTPKKRLD